ncbi:MAG: DUF6305 family protein [Candidatus Aminicenantes bacterium]|nr:DUF6305 family protein [Candidatus Aminicenantes bacterium]
MIKRNKGIPALLIALSLLAPAAARAQSAVKAEEPALLTSCGQSPGPVMLKVVMQRLKMGFELNSLASASDLKSKKDAGTPYKSIVIVMGASLKGMGAAGISIDDELMRTAALIEEARKEGILVIGAHIEGMKRRSQGASAGDTTDEQSIDAVAPQADLLLINKEGNADGRFTAIAQAKKIPLLEVAKNLDLVAEIQKLYGK